MQGNKAKLVLLTLLSIVVLPIVLPLGTVAAQTDNYTINQVNRQVEVLYSGHVIIKDTIYVSGQVSDGFLVGLPYVYGVNVLKGYAYDDNNHYQLNLGVQFGEGSGFYGASVDFNGKNPQVFTVAFVLSNALVREQSPDLFALDFPAYPSLTKNAGACSVTLSFPSSPSSIMIAKDDGEVNVAQYSMSNLPAYTHSQASAAFTVPIGSIQIVRISQLNRQVTLGPNGEVTASDSYRIVNNSTGLLNAFVINLPLNAQNVVVRDELGRTLPVTTQVSGNTMLVNATLITFISTGQATTLIAQYNLPSATITNSQYTLPDFVLFPNNNYYIEQASFSFIPPEGATIFTPKLSDLDFASTLTRESFQDTLRITRNGISNLDNSLHLGNVLTLSYEYNLVWVSLRPTFWAAFLGVVGCLAVVVIKKRKPQEEEEVYIDTKAEKLAVQPSSTLQMQDQEEDASAESVVAGQRLTADEVREFTEAYDERKQLITELKALDIKAQKGKIPRRQYKVQRRAIEVRLENIKRSTRKLKNIIRASSVTNANLMKQIDSSEAELVEVEKNIRDLEIRQSKGEISLEVYKRNLADYQRRKDKAEATINGILLRLREKIR